MKNITKNEISIDTKTNKKNICKMHLKKKSRKFKKKNCGL